MNLELQISAASTIVALVSFAFAFVCLKKLRNHRELLEFNAKQTEELEKSLSNSKDLLEESRQKVNDQARRVAWLESRVRQPKTAKKDVVEEQEVQIIEEKPVVNKSNITERRHRVLTLASRGQSPETIASTLGMMPGEVELIINLNRAIAA
ncbi:MAG TPA: hypothetical protein PKY59_23200 [Pyrinomonadaceae bacterium]|nr:hypothetical protein [Pyrinomonadaceae bacterium]